MCCKKIDPCKDPCDPCGGRKQFSKSNFGIKPDLLRLLEVLYQLDAVQNKPKPVV